MILIYVPKTSSRVVYTFRHICKRILGLEVDFTSKIESFIAHEGPKFSYGKQQLGKELYFQSVELLFEQGLNDVVPTVQEWDDTKGFFAVKNEASALPFDIFAASFFLLSRYEEYLPHVKDDKGRYVASESLAYKNKFLQDPVVDIWALKFLKIIKDKFPEVKTTSKNFSIAPVVVVSQTFAYNQKGIIRSLGGVFRDLWFFNLKEVSDRIKVILNLRKDPYNTFDYLIDLQRKKKRDLRVMIGLGDYTTYEKNISYNNPVHQRLIKHIADYIKVGLKLSYDAIADMTKLKKEKARIELILNRQLQYSFCSFNKIKLPVAYRNLIELEVKEDYSLGYADFAGFRAGTCHPFLFYDLDYEVQTPLMVHPISISYQSFVTGVDLETVKNRMLSIIDKVKSVNGIFIPIFSNGLFSELSDQQKWKEVFELIWNFDEG
ncbi:polysaccharide deacetylase family protein [Aquimarina brevivitae]|uniref:DUF7033 domain-containing protein n=1 Tax=Aquimarina brevivitae TaxID=323412 RepID=A0A4Q7PHC1_9FLAO|nr:polysaccharide deacetylase family protein [Aquimarina brevivitae]RZS99934.1 hypothetical protein EV197_1165 [Aquimarina brevivitae]